MISERLALDSLDRRLIRLLTDSPRIGVMEMARQLGVARGTAQSRLEKLGASGVGKGFGPDIDPAAMGDEGLAVARSEIARGRLNDGVDPSRQLPQVVTKILEVRGITRTTTVIALSEQIGYRVIPLVEAEP